MGMSVSHKISDSGGMTNFTYMDKRCSNEEVVGSFPNQSHEIRVATYPIRVNGQVTVLPSSYAESLGMYLGSIAV